MHQTILGNNPQVRKLGEIRVQQFPDGFIIMKKVIPFGKLLLPFVNCPGYFFRHASRFGGLVDDSRNFGRFLIVLAEIFIDNLIRYPHEFFVT
jgi:hypothetical protein